jgi:hypothetical protein
MNKVPRNALLHVIWYTCANICTLYILRSKIAYVEG